MDCMVHPVWECVGTGMSVAPTMGNRGSSTRKKGHGGIGRCGRNTREAPADTRPRLLAGAPSGIRTLDTLLQGWYAGMLLMCAMMANVEAR